MTFDVISRSCLPCWIPLHRKSAKSRLQLSIYSRRDPLQYNRHPLHTPEIRILHPPGQSSVMFLILPIINPCRSPTQISISRFNLIPKTHICTVVNSNSILSVCAIKSALKRTTSSFLHTAHLIFLHPSLTLLPLPSVRKLG
jgi:hypothetical protein